MAMPTSAAARAGASFTPSPVTATMSHALEGANNAELVGGGGASDDRSLPEGVHQLAVVQVSQFCAADQWVCRR